MLSRSMRHLEECVRRLIKPALYIAVIKGFFGLGLAAGLMVGQQEPTLPHAMPAIELVKVKLVPLEQAKPEPLEAPNLTTGALVSPPIVTPIAKPDSPSPVKPVPARRPRKPAQEKPRQSGVKVEPISWPKPY
jgi:hypothetical protein